ncbi:MAG: SprB repeat-containing protein, partial [Bacteroidetes bacterium]|nr:SprB repeat-containing protein [Bacteroidota bacterium]
MSTLFWRQLSAPVAACLLAMLVPFNPLDAQSRHWVGGNGQWNDAMHWSAVANGNGGAGVPRSGDAVFIAASTGNVVVTMGAAAETGNLTVLGNGGQVRLEGGRGRLQVSGTMEVKGNVAWAWPGTVDLAARSGVAELDLHGIPLGGDLRFTGGGTWSMRSDLVIGDEAALMIDNGTLATNGNMLRAGSLRLGNQGAKLMAGSSVVLLAQSFQPGTARNTVDAGSSKLLVGGAPAEWGPAAIAPAEELRAQNVCATGVGQTPFVIDAQLMSNYNGFGVSCHGVCNGQVRVVVTGGIGPFTYQWVGGPTTALWNNVCPG